MQDALLIQLQPLNLPGTLYKSENRKSDGSFLQLRRCLSPQKRSFAWQIYVTLY